MADDESYGLVMPFVAVASRGGPFDDSAYVHGYEMGRLDATLSPQIAHYHEATIHVANQGQADLIAMRHGYTMRLITAADGWVEVAFAEDWDAIEEASRG